MKTKDENKIFALYDEHDRPLGCFDRKQLGILLKKDNAGLNNVMCRIRRYNCEAVYVGGKKYRVFVYDEKEEE